MNEMFIYCYITNHPTTQWLKPPSLFYSGIGKLHGKLHSVWHQLGGSKAGGWTPPRACSLLRGQLTLVVRASLGLGVEHLHKA